MTLFEQFPVYKQLLWPEPVIRNHIRPAAKRAGIAKPVTWHCFRHSFSTLLVDNNNDVKTAQQMMRHANSRVTLNCIRERSTKKSGERKGQIVRQVLSGRVLSTQAAGNI